jgi:hypothetical protein
MSCKSFHLVLYKLICALLNHQVEVLYLLLKAGLSAQILITAQYIKVDPVVNGMYMRSKSKYTSVMIASNILRSALANNQ